MNFLEKIYQKFPAFRHKNYKLYFTGQLISFTGSWLQGVAHGWLVFNLTHSPFWLGVASALSSLPVLILSLFGGFLVDRFNRKKLLYFTQSSLLILAAILGLLTITNTINLHLLLLLNFLFGIIHALDNPANQAFVADIIKKEDLPSVIGLNSTIFNTSKVIAPAIAGFLVAFLGMGSLFLINALSFLAILTSLYFIKIEIQITRVQENPITAIKKGIQYAIDHPILNILLLTTGVGAIFSFSQATIMPVIAERIFSYKPLSLGYLLSAIGLGAICGSMLVSVKTKKEDQKKLIIMGNILFLISSFAFSYTTNIYLALPLLFISGLGLTIQFSSLYCVIQKVVQEEYRGRVCSIYVLMFIGLSPIGNLFLGSITTFFGPQIAIRLSTLIVLFYGAILYLYRTFGNTNQEARLNINTSLQNLTNP